MNQTFSYRNITYYAANLMSWINSNDVMDAACTLVIKGRECQHQSSLSGFYQGCAFTRTLDNWIILIQTRKQLRKIVKNMHAMVHGLGLKLALKKTFIGRIKKGFDFLGYRFDLNGLGGLAQKTIGNHMNKLARLYEQNASDQRVCEYKLNWMRWVRAGIVSWR